MRRGIAYDLQKDLPTAARYYRDAIKIEEKVYGPEHYLHFSWNLALAQVLAKTRDTQAEAVGIVDGLIERWRNNPDIESDYAELMLLRCDLYAANGNFSAARTLAVETLQRPQLVASAERTSALKRHAE